MTTSPDGEFERKLEVFRIEAETGTQFFNAYLAVHKLAANHKPVHKLLNQAPLFWTTCLGALQTAAFIALGRVFDQRSAHNLDKLLRFAQDNRQIFSKAALGRRKQGNNPESPAWLDEYVRDAYEPTAADFRCIRAHIQRRRNIYNTNYQDLRDKLFAHKEVPNGAEAATLLVKTNIREVQRIFSFLGSLHEALSQLFFNGRKPVLQPLRYSVRQKITHEAKQFLMFAAGADQQRVTRGAR